MTPGLTLPPEIAVPPLVNLALEAGATLAVSISGGKDGQAALELLASRRRDENWPGRFVAVHADLGRAEWSHTGKIVREQAERAGAKLKIVRHPKGDLVDRIEREATRLGETRRLVFPSSKARYCTSDMKRDQILKAVRQDPCNMVISVQGLRAEESATRRRKPQLSVEKRATAERLKDILTAMDRANLPTLEKRERLTLNWLAVQHLTLDDVWTACGTSSADLARRRRLYLQRRRSEALEGWPCDPVYVMGNRRKSCSICVLACESDMINGARHNPPYAQTLLEIERRTGQTFRAGLSIQTIIDKAARLEP